MLANGNSWDPQVTLNCTWCGIGKQCDTCHRHAQKRGECNECTIPKVKLEPDGKQAR